MNSIIIYDSNGNILYNDIPVTSSAELVQELMRSDYVQLSFNWPTNEVLPAGAYILPFGQDGEKYSLLEPYSPEQKNEREWNYKPQFVSQFYGASKVPFFMYTTTESGTTKEADWTLTDNPANFMERLKAAFLNEMGIHYTYAVDNNLQVASATLQFNCVDIISACNQIADAFKTELWLEKLSTPDASGNIGVLHLGKASFGTPITLQVGNNIKVPTVTKGGEFFNRFYVFGSSRNITQDYQGATVSNIAVKRLTLNPTTYPNGYIDFSNNGPVYSKILQFDDVYPSATDLVVMNIRPRTKYVLDESTSKPIVIGGTTEEPIYDTYTIWYFQLKRLVDGQYVDFDFSESMVLPGYPNPSIHFNSGPLSGREFEVIYHATGGSVKDSSDPYPFVILDKDFEIKFQDENGFIIPSSVGLVPQTDNLVVLFNVEMPDAYVASAQARLAQVAIEEINKNYLNTTTLEPVDKNEYQVASDPTVFSTSEPSLKLGSAVVYVNGAYQHGTRVLGLHKRLDLSCYQNITFGDNIVKGNIEELKEEAVSANRNIDLLDAISKSTQEVTAAYERTHQLILKQLADQGSFWMLDERTVEGATVRSVKLNPIYAGVWTDGFVTAGGYGSGGGGGGGLIEQVYRIGDFGGTFDQNRNDTFNAYAINSLHLRILSLEQNPGGVTSVAGLTGAVSASDLITALGLGAAARMAVGSIASGNTGLVSGGDVYSFVNSSVATATAEYKGNYNVVSDLNLSYDATHSAIEAKLGQTISGADNNDYCFVEIPTSASDPTQIAKIERYKFNGTSWAYEYVLNNSSFTAAQWAAINSGINSVKVAAYETIAGYFSNGVLGDSHLPTITLSGDVSGSGRSSIAVTIGNGKVTNAMLAGSISNDKLANSSLTIGSTAISLGGTTAVLAGLTSVTSQKFYLTSDLYFEVVDGNVHLHTPSGKGFWTEGFVTAGGVGSGGGGGGGLITDVYRIGDFGGTFGINDNDTFNAYAINSLYTSIQSLNTAVGSKIDRAVLWASLQNNDIVSTYDNYKIAGSHIPDMAGTYGYLKSADIDAYLQSLQSQIDSVAARTNFDDLVVTSLFSDVASASSLYAETIYLGGTSVASSLSSLSTAISNEATTRANADSGLSIDISNEATARANADSALSSAINGVASRTTTLERNFDANGNAKSALKLTTVSKTIWGQTYWTSGGVPQNVTAAPNLYIGGSKVQTSQVAQALVGISSISAIVSPGSDDNTKIEWDANANAWHFHGGIYADTFVTAGGEGSGGSVPTTLDAVWNTLRYNTGDYQDVQIDVAHIPGLPWSKIISGKPSSLAGYGILDAYTKTEVDNLIGAIDQFHYEIYPSLSDITTPAGNVLYLIGPTGSGSDKYEEYVYANGSFTKIGDTTIDLSAYLTITSAQATYQPIISDLATIRTQAGHGETAYNSLDTISDCLQSLQSQIDSVATRNDFDELNASSVFSDIVAATSLYVGSITLDGNDLATTISNLSGRIGTVEGKFTGDSANSALRLAGTSAYSIWGVEYWSSGVPKSVTGRPGLFIGSTQVQTNNSSQPLAGITTITASGLATISGGISLGGQYENADSQLVDSKLVWDNDAKAWHLIGNFYADGFITAGGVGTSGGGGVDLDRVWASLTNSIADSHANDKIALVHIPDMANVYGYLKENQTITLTGVVTGSGTTSIATSIANNALSIAMVSGLQSALDSKTSNVGTVTSVGLSMPTGFSVSSSPITASGTLSVSFASGYSLLTSSQISTWNGKQDAITDLATIRSNASNGNTAYGWGNHANAGYFAASSFTASNIVSTLGNTAVNRATADTAGENIANNFTTVGNALKSLQSQIDSVASRSVYDELTATNLYSDMAVGVSAYFSNFYGNLTGTASNATNADNADKLDGVHASGLFTELTTSAGSTNLYITIGGTRLSKTIYAYYDSDGGVIASNMTTIGTALRSLQGQIDSVAARTNFDDLVVTSLFSDAAAISTLYAETIFLGGTSIASSLSSLSSAIDGVASRATTLERNFDANGNAKSALKLTTTSKTAWGQTYWTSGGVPDNISGNMSNVGNISMNGSISGAMTISASGLATIQGGISLGGQYNQQDSKLVWDSTNNAWHLIGNFYADGFITAGATGSSSDARLKDNIEEVSAARAIELLSALKGKEWTWNDKKEYLSGKHGSGLIAQEVIPVMPWAVLDLNGEYSLNYNTLWGVAIPVMQSHEQRIEALERENKELKRKIEILTNNS